MTISPAELSIAIPSRTCPACGETTKQRGQLLCYACRLRLPAAARMVHQGMGISPGLAAWILEQLGASEFRLPEAPAIAD